MSQPRPEWEDAADPVEYWAGRARAAEAERDLLRAKLTAHHAIHNLPDDLVRDWAISYDHTCPVCKEVEHARTAGE